MGNRVGGARRVNMARSALLRGGLLEVVLKTPRAFSPKVFARSW